MYRAWVMREHVGDAFDALVTGVMSYGLFVQVGSPFVEGLIKRESLGHDHWDTSPGGAYLLGQRTGKRFGLGSPIRVRLLDSSVVRRQITFELENPPAPPPRRGRGGHRGGPRVRRGGPPKRDGDGGRGRKRGSGRKKRKRR